jgi:hypothetical protein
MRWGVRVPMPGYAVIATDAGNSRVEDEAGKEHQGVEHLVVTEHGGHRVRAASAVDQGTE